MERAAASAALSAFQDNWQLIADAQTSVRGGDAGCEDDGNGSQSPCGASIMDPDPLRSCRRQTRLRLQPDIRSQTQLRNSSGCL